MNFAIAPANNTDATSTSGAAKRIARWLLDSSAQLREGPHAGAVAGTFNADGRPKYAYPEITGYFLQWLAWYACKRETLPREKVSDRTVPKHNATPLALRAQAAQDWLARWAAEELPFTRIHLVDRATDDWRNRTVFTFDIAMVLRGIASAANQGLLSPNAELIHRLNLHLSRLIAADGLLNACLEQTGALLPGRWSTRRGGFLAKAAAGILRAGEALPGVNFAVMEAAENTFAASLEWATTAPHRDAHPLLYSYEGTLSLMHHRGVDVVLPRFIEAFTALVDDARFTGYIMETGGDGSGPKRVDVLAQVLRVYDLLQHLVAWPESMAQFIMQSRSRLTSIIGPDGGVPFAFADTSGEVNVWSAMFASQALEGMKWGNRAMAGPPDRALRTSPPHRTLKAEALRDSLRGGMLHDPLLV